MLPLFSLGVIVTDKHPTRNLYPTPKFANNDKGCDAVTDNRAIQGGLPMSNTWVKFARVLLFNYSLTNLPTYPF